MSAGLVKLLQLRLELTEQCVKGVGVRRRIDRIEVCRNVRHWPRIDAREFCRYRKVKALSLQCQVFYKASRGFNVGYEQINEEAIEILACQRLLHLM